MDIVLRQAQDEVYRVVDRNAALLILSLSKDDSNAAS